MSEENFDPEPGALLHALLRMLAPPEIAEQDEDGAAAAPPAAPRRDLDCAALLMQPSLSLGANPLLLAAPAALPAVAALLARRLASPELRRLDLSGCRVGGAALAALAPASRALEALDLRSSDLQSAAELAPLAAPGALPALRHLALDGNFALLRRPRWRDEVLALLPRLATLNGGLARFEAECDAAAAENAPGAGIDAVERLVCSGAREPWLERTEPPEQAGAPEAELRAAVAEALAL
jgi:hypothetical protein